VHNVYTLAGAEPGSVKIRYPRQEEVVFPMLGLTLSSRIFVEFIGGFNLAPACCTEDNNAQASRK
jgi:hypothetical protein